MVVLTYIYFEAFIHEILVCQRDDYGRMFMNGRFKQIIFELNCVFYKWVLSLQHGIPYTRVGIIDLSISSTFSSYYEIVDFVVFVSPSEIWVDKINGV